MSAICQHPGGDGLHLVLLSEQAKLFLGTQRAAVDGDLLRRNQITKIVCVGTPRFHPNEFEYLEVPVLDIPSENLLVRFDACASFIETGMRSGRGVLVNCVFAQSRSPTVVVAYLMKQKGVALADAMEMIRTAQPTININPGFQAQLMLYRDMNCRLTASDGLPALLMAHATFRWFLFACQVRKYGECLPLDTENWEKRGRDDTQTMAGGMQATTRSYRCKACRASLFYGRNVIDHLHPVVLAANETTYESIARYGDGISWSAARDAASAGSTVGPMNSTARKAKRGSLRNGRSESDNNGSASRSPTTSDTCTSVFTEVLPWIGMVDASGRLSGAESLRKITCPGRNGMGCGSKIGAWNLQGTTCSCGRTVKPSVQFTLSRIEVA